MRDEKSTLRSFNLEGVVFLGGLSLRVREFSVVTLRDGGGWLRESTGALGGAIMFPTGKTMGGGNMFTTLYLA